MKMKQRHIKGWRRQRKVGENIKHIVGLRNMKVIATPKGEAEVVFENTRWRIFQN